MIRLSRRDFLAAATSAAVIPSLTAKSVSAQTSVIDHSLAGRVFKTLKIGMVKVDGTLTDKFLAAREAGFDAIELDAPLRFSNHADVDSVKKAISESGLPVDGTVCGSHWKITHTSPKPDVRKMALKDLTDAIQQTRAIGGSTVLLVAGKGKDGTAEDIEARAIENISKALPVAAQNGVTIAIENVWNKMHYDHEGGLNQTADRYVNFVDAFNSPFVGMQFDIGNHWKYGNVADWIRELGKRIVKLDLKGFSRTDDKFTNIGYGDIDWAACRKALLEINFHGFAAAEVKGGGLDRLKDVAANCDAVLGLG